MVKPREEKRNRISSFVFFCFGEYLKAKPFPDCQVLHLKEGNWFTGGEKKLFEK